MERGLLWLPLLFAFFWLAWQGSQEFKKVEAYRVWAEQFDKAKYDIYAVLGLKENNITWGKPTPKGMVQLETFSLDDVVNIQLVINDKPVDIEQPPDRGRTITLEFIFSEARKSLQIPFTEVEIAANWGKFLQKKLEISSSDD
jgi:hypothetical protein